MNLLLLGATGLVGSHTLRLALIDQRVTKVIAPTRKPLPAADRLINPVGARFEELIPPLMSYQPDAVICALGTTQAKAGSKEAFRYVDRDLPVAVGYAAHGAGVHTYALVSALGASPTASSFYYRTKGEVERDIQKIGFRSLTICRPSLIAGERNEARTAEGALLVLLRLLSPVLPKKLHANPADKIASCLLKAAIAAQVGQMVISAESMH